MDIYRIHKVNKYRLVMLLIFLQIGLNILVEKNVSMDLIKLLIINQVLLLGQQELI